MVYFPSSKLYFYLAFPFPKEIERVPAVFYGNIMSRCCQANHQLLDRSIWRRILNQQQHSRKTVSIPYSTFSNFPPSIVLHWQLWKVSAAFIYQNCLSPWAVLIIGKEIWPFCWWAFLTIRQSCFAIILAIHTSSTSTQCHRYGVHQAHKKFFVLHSYVCTMCCRCCPSFQKLFIPPALSTATSTALAKVTTLEDW